MDLLHREQGLGFVEPGHNLILALEVPTGVPIRNLPMVRDPSVTHRVA
jgi:hypothetical protein